MREEHVEPCGSLKGLWLLHCSGKVLKDFNQKKIIKGIKSAELFFAHWSQLKKGFVRTWLVGGIFRSLYLDLFQAVT